MNKVHEVFNVFRLQRAEELREMGKIEQVKVLSKHLNNKPLRMSTCPVLNGGKWGRMEEENLRGGDKSER